MNDSVTLFLIFFRIGAFTFGGGYSMLPILQRELVDSRHWLKEEEIMDFYAVGQCLPGLIAVNTSLFIGYHLKKLKGALIAVFGFVLPSVIVILVIAVFLSNFMHYPQVKQAFAGIRVAVCALVANTLISMFKKGIVDWFTAVLFAGALAVLLFTDVSPIWIVLTAGISALAYKQIGSARQS
ncbi:MAG: chromate transporter [Erysipelotrichaceae bacterium]|jgi:chromate transporter|nr:chromate transporter [Erysipelotrichaceae bacterium]